MERTGDFSNHCLCASFAAKKQPPPSTFLVIVADPRDKQKTATAAASRLALRAALTP